MNENNLNQRTKRVKNFIFIRETTVGRFLSTVLCNKRFAHIAHQKEGMSESLIFEIKKTNIQHTKKKILDFFSQNF